MKYISNSEKSTRDAGFKFGKNLKGGEIVFFSGILGAGKTVFVRGIAKALKINNHIKSPTFTVFKAYDGCFVNGKQGKIYHFDCYRLNKLQDLLDLGWEEILHEKSSVILLEWPECIIDFKLPREKTLISFTLGEKGERIINY